MKYLLKYNTLNLKYLILEKKYKDLKKLTAEEIINKALDSTNNEEDKKFYKKQNQLLRKQLKELKDRFKNETKKS